jgi:putative copper resistance protein D
MSIALGLLHGLDFLLSAWLIGAIVFHCLIVKAGGPEAEALIPDWPRKAALLTALTFFSSFLWMLFTASDMAESWKPADLWIAMSQTQFGHVWCLRLVLLLLMVILTRFIWRPRKMILLGLAALVPLASALTGHAGGSESKLALHLGVDWSHSIAVAVWTGGLWTLRSWLGQRLTLNSFGTEIGVQVVRRFSHFALISTFVIAITGIVMAYFAGVSLVQPWETIYGQVALAKLLVFCAALGAAAINQFFHLRTWNSENDRQTTMRLRREVSIELVLIVIVFGLAGFLTRTSLPID